MPNINRKEKTLMSELQGPRIPGEERSGRRRPLGWIIGGLLALLLLALLIPFACQALRGGSDSQGEGFGAQEKAAAQGADDVQGGGGAGGADGGENTGTTGAGKNTRAEPTGGNGLREGEEAAAETDRAAGSGAEEGEQTSDKRADATPGGDLPETGGMSPVAMLAIGTVLLLMGSAGLFAVVRRCSANGG
jgi:LPXTG-motif cell wall-anchored protein